MPERNPRRAALAAAGALLALAAIAGPAAAPAAAASGVPSGGPAGGASGAPAAASSAGARVPASLPQAIGGTLLSGRGVIVSAARGVPRLPGVHASAFVIADAGTGQVLAAKDPHGWYLPASTLKVLTAITLIPLLNPDALVVASQQAASAVPNDVGLLPGHPYRVSALFTALLTISANDAAIALTQAAGSYGQGMALINAEARHLQADDTVAVDPNGLDAPGQHTSAYDLALFARQALGMPAFLTYDETTGGLFQIKRHKEVGLYNQNSLLTSYPGAIGGKIGWTSAAGATYVGMARRHGVTLIVTLLHCPALTEISSAETLLNWGFAADGKVTPVGQLVGPLQPHAPAAAAPAPSPTVRAAVHHSVAGPSALAAAGFTCVAVTLAMIGFAYTRRQRPGGGGGEPGGGHAGPPGQAQAAPDRPAPDRPAPDRPAQ
ncbi:MAG TPA: D-alanyl-D-alanine carboxypeptidase [Streptosporangiaceae bacterium]